MCLILLSGRRKIGTFFFGMVMASNNSSAWYKKVLGSELVYCQSGNDNGSGIEKNVTPTEELFENFSKNYGEDTKLIIGLYFAPLGIPDECLNHLVQLYHLVNLKNRENNYEVEGCKNLLEVIQIFLSSSVHWLDRCTVDESKVLAQLKGVPWYAVPVRDKDQVVRLTRRYQIKSFAPSLILLNGKTGEIITKHGRERLLEDPKGNNFPWKPRPLHSVLHNVELLPGGKCDQNEISSFQNLKGLIVGFYFSAHWCPPCRGFTPQLIETYNRLRSNGTQFEIIFVSSDRSIESYESYLATMPWLAVPFCNQECRRELASLFGVQGIPTLLIVDSDGDVITYDGRGEINDDPMGQLFPWRPRLVNMLSERHAARLQDVPAVVLFVEGEESEMRFAEAVLTPAAKDFADGQQNNEMPLEFYIAYDSDTSDTLREFVGIDDAIPLLIIINLPEGTWAAMEDGAEIDEESVKKFVSRFLSNELPMNSICNDRRSTRNCDNSK